MLLEAKIDPEVVAIINRNLPGVDVYDAMDEVAEIVEYEDETETFTE